MIKHRSIFIILFLAMLALVIPASSQASVQAAAVSQDKFKDRTATAEFYTVDPSDGCIIRGATLIPTEGRIPAGSSSLVSSVYVSMYGYNTCTAQFTLDGATTADLTVDAFKVDNRIQLATLNVTVEVYDNISQTSSPVTINLTWTGVGDLFQQRSVYSNNTPHCRYRSIFMGSSRDASVSGSILYNGADYASGEVLYKYGAIGDAKGGTMNIGCTS